jgi:hypothetical protein
MRVVKPSSLFQLFFWQPQNNLFQLSLREWLFDVIHVRAVNSLKKIRGGKIQTQPIQPSRSALCVAKV